jgi:DNA repair protein RecO (recombination protein O)
VFVQGGRRADTRMPLRESEAIILRTFPLGEADRLVSFFGRSTGRLRGVARGARRPNSRFGSTLEPLSHIRIWFYERETRELVRIQQCELVRSFLEVQKDYGASLALAVVSEISEALLPEREPSDAVFRLILLTAAAIDRGTGAALPLAYFELWMLRLGGWLPPLDRCSRCGRELKDEKLYTTVSGAGVACEKCRRPGMRVLSAGAAQLARRIIAEKLENLMKEKIDAEDLKQLSEYLLDLIEHHMERKLITRELLETQG